jgi:hypothetical protein
MTAEDVKAQWRKQQEPPKTWSRGTALDQRSTPSKAEILLQQIDSGALDTEAQIEADRMNVESLRKSGKIAEAMELDRTRSLRIEQKKRDERDAKYQRDVVRALRGSLPTQEEVSEWLPKRR